MITAKLFQNGRSQAVRLPKEFRFEEGQDEVLIKKIGDAVVLFPKSSPETILMNALEKFPDDFEIDRINKAPTRIVEL